MQNSTDRRGDPAYGPWTLQRAVFLGLGLALIGVFAGDTNLLGCGAVIWIFGYAYCAPWWARAIRFRDPVEDHYLASAILGWAATPWGLFMLFEDALTRPSTIYMAVLGAIAPGAAAAITTVYRWRPRPPSPLRTAFLVSGGVAYLGWVATYVWLIAGAASDNPVLGIEPSTLLVMAIFMLPAPVMALWMAARLFAAPFEAAG